MPARDVPVRQTSLRAHNLALVLRLVAASPAPISRAWIATASGLTRATVSTIVDELIAGGLVGFADESAQASAAPPSGSPWPAPARPGSAWRSTSTIWPPA